MWIVGVCKPTEVNETPKLGHSLCDTLGQVFDYTNASYTFFKGHIYCQTITIKTI